MSDYDELLHLVEQINEAAAVTSASPPLVELTSTGNTDAISVYQWSLWDSENGGPDVEDHVFNSLVDLRDQIDAALKKKMLLGHGDG